VGADVQLDQVASEVAEHVRVLAQEKGVVFQTGAVDKCQLKGDADGLRRLLFNVLENAVKYTPEGGKVTLDLKRCGGQVEIIVSDNGVGIPAEHLPHVFSRFYRVDAARQGDGTGLGLPISRAIAESHGGQIAIESESGQGTRVKVKLDCRQP
jgi:signal transduction histidine kinase